MKKIVIVNKGGRGVLSAEKGSYDNMCASLKAMFERVRKHGNPDDQIVEVWVVDDEEAAKPMQKGDVLIFVSLSELDLARKIKKRNPWMKVVVLTGLLPDDEVAIIDKEWLSQRLVDTLVESTGGTVA